MTENKNRCVVTGLGLICAVGNNVTESWDAVCAARSGIAPLSSVSTEGCYADIGAEVKAADLDALPGAERMDRVSKLCVKASQEAATDAGLFLGDENLDRVGVIMGSCVGGAVSIEHYYKNGECAEDIDKMTISPIANHVADRFGARGIVTNVANACAAGTISIAYACELIRAGQGDVFIVGGADAFASVPYAGFISLHALDPDSCSPFNRSSGITLGEGSGALVVESYEHAVKRGAHIYCEVLGAGISSDAHHITAPRPDGEGQMNAIRRAIRVSGISPAEIGYINAHGTGTAKNDEAEFLSLHTIFDEECNQLHVSSTKSMVGHCLGAAGAIEAVFTVKALTEGMIPPTIGYTEEGKAALAEKAGKIDFMPNEAKRVDLTSVMSNSFAFGGNNASIIFSKTAGNVSTPAEHERIYVTGIGIVSPVGNGKDAYLSALESGMCPDGNSVLAAVTGEDYARCGLKMAFYRKLDKFSQLQAVSGMDALLDASLTVDGENATDIGIIVGTADGPVATVCKFEKELAAKGNAAGSAFHFPNTVYNAAGGYLSICSGIKGYNVTVTNGAQSGLASVAYAMNVIRSGCESTMLATGTDENCEVMTELYGKRGLLASDGGEGITLGEGSTTLVIESDSRANERGARRYAELLGYGMTHDAKSPAEALSRAIKLAAADAGIALSDISAVVGHACGISEIDSAECEVYKGLLGEIPVCNVREVTGEGRAASAALSAAHASLLLSGELGENEYKYVLVTAADRNGSYSALILGRA